MFGYVKIFKPQLKVCEYDSYKAIYCTLCKRIGKKYGLIFRLMLNYDFAFLAMVKLSLTDNICTYERKRCTVNPLKKCNYCSNNQDAFDFASGVSVIMIYHSIIDKITDEIGFKRLFYKALRLIVYRKFKKASTDYPKVNDIVKVYIDNQFKIEQKNAVLDAASEPTAVALGKIFELLRDNTNDKRILYRVGYCVGKWIYIADALDDLDRDIKSGRFNPLKGRQTDDVGGTLNVCSTDAGVSFGLLDSKIFTPIINNVFYLGMPNEIKRIMKKRDEKNE